MTTGDRVANVVFMLCCAGLLGMAAARAWRPADGTHVAREQIIAAGAADPFGLPSSARTRVCVLVSTACHVCRESLPFYKRLWDLGRAGRAADVIFVGLDSEADLRAYLGSGGIHEPPIASVARAIGVPGTPTIVALDPAGRVAHSWAGRLSRRQELEVTALVTGR